MSADPEKAVQSPRILPVGDQAVSVEFGDTISDEINDRVYALADLISADSPGWAAELVPSYRALLVRYDALEFDFSAVTSELRQLISELPAEGSASRGPVSVYELPTAYGGDHGPDLGAVAENAGITEDEAVKVHSGRDYRVYMIGFSPGFPYLGGMDSRIATPRLSTPRTKVPAGSVGIAESQTGVYPNESPGGWQLIGRTPVQLFDPNREPPAVLQPGHFVRFVPVTPDEYSKIESEVAAGTFEISAREIES